jgi:cytochrome c oxidase cbb3-type subunit 3
MSTFWSWFVIALTVGNIVGCVWLLQAQSRLPAGHSEKDTTGHVWDKDLTEYNKPMPRWWLILFWITAVFGAAYLVIYPGLGTFAGTQGWTQSGQYERERTEAEARYGDVFRAFANVPLAELAKNQDAVRLGRNLFLNNCATCHGSDARGARGFPNLTDKAWLHGGSPEAIELTITNGRTGSMPALGAAVGEQGVAELTAYVWSLSHPGTGDAAAIAAGAQKFQMFCIACHGADGRGNQALGAPDLTDDDWLHVTTAADIGDVIMKGRVNQMPAQQGTLGADRIRVLVAYVLSLGADAGG